ncbi:WxL domain-containing protein [Limosilactobacillus ingluviei]|uniref:WxL domain-containing protein n=1 Tax=Limosilactobacillus ingluviei TaxID=148604 RepID=UPI0024B8C877|nr:WxL domain-containing protein [Limosilactobacillus ingluviei]
MKRNFWTKLGLLSLACGLFLTAPAAIINADDTTITKSSTATLKLDSSDAKLSLDAVPSFPFGTVKTGEILSGQPLSNNDLSDNNKITVTDTRLDAKGWQLTVKPTAFINNGKTIAGTLDFTPGTFAFADGQAEGWTGGSTSLSLPGSSTKVASSTGDQEGTASAAISAATFNATSHNALASGTYTSTLTWNLNATPDPSASE